MKINKKIFCMFLLLLSLSFTKTAFAMKLAPFPDSKSLQPMPTFVYPNVSGNVNADLGGNPPLNQENEDVTNSPPSDISETENPPETTPLETPLQDESSFYFLVYGIATILIITALWIFLLKKKNRDYSE